ncbi:hypothetical protein PCASD_10107 [Puccinia coronata f. sp. avenae]|uniref:Uncharacterized protein n=1 Tax=Puccinia coronata f. sp. avenae TaxID=200324 RepID=A0A2N5UU81_9BASI|nr:hypothetical protein PCASD_10107 [Puccinia coronata f. sp. avenae]
MEEVFAAAFTIFAIPSFLDHFTSIKRILQSTEKAGARARIKPSMLADVVALIVSAIHNREPVNNISKLLGSSCSTLSSTPDGLSSGKDRAGFDCQLIFQEVSAVIGPASSTSWGFDFNICLPTCWSVGYDLWRFVLRLFSCCFGFGFLTFSSP